MSRHTYEAILEKQSDGWIAHFPQIPEAYADGNTRNQAIRNAADVLALVLADYIENSNPLPEEQHVAECVSLSVELTDRDIEATHYMGIKQAADELGIGASRVSQLLKSKRLEGKYFDGTHMVSIESIQRYKQSPREPGRPGKTGKQEARHSDFRKSAASV